MSKTLRPLCLVLVCALTGCLTYAVNYEKSAKKFEQQEQWTEARRAWQEELSQHPKNLDARYRLAKLLEEAGHQADAQALYKKNMQIGKHLNTVIALSQLYRNENNLELAVKLLKKASKDFRNEAVPWYLLAGIAVQNKLPKQANDYFQKALNADPMNAFAYLRYAQFLSDKKQHSQSIKYAAKALRLKKKCAPCWRIYGDLLRAADQPQNALQAYQRSLAIQPDSNTRQHLIDLLAQLGEHQRAARMQQALDAWKKNNKKN